MIESHMDPRTGTGHLIVQPNQSLSWAGNKRFLAFMSAVIFTVAGAFAGAGAWLVLPFAGLESAALGAALYWSCLKLQRREVIIFAPEEVIIQKGRKGPEEETKLSRHWVSFTLQAPQSALGAQRLVARLHRKEVELAAQLNDDEKRQLHARLSQLKPVPFG